MANVKNHSLFTEFDINLFKAGKLFRAYNFLGSHIVEVDGEWGVQFAVWAPSARSVSVKGNFNGWNATSHPLSARWDGSGIWEGFIPGLGKGDLYKYHVQSADGRQLEKGDPYALFWEIPPNTASIVWEMNYEWQDGDWMQKRRNRQGLHEPYSVYEVHLGTWRKKNGGKESLSYRELGDELVNYVQEMGYTHIEFLPVMEHPYFPSWGYQVTGYFAPTSRFGTPEDFMYMIDRFHQAEIGVLLDWVPSHFPADAHGLADFDGTHLYDHADPRKGFHPDWKSCIFNYGRNEVRSFLISNALFWLERYHTDGLRVDAVASMLYLDYSREDGEWIPNQYGGNENLEAIDFLREFNETVYREYPDTITIAEESTAWSGVSRPTYTGGLGFGMKWMMGWMHDTLNYFKHDPIHRQYHHNEITFSLVYSFTENFMLPLSHDEVVHGKGSLMDRMPGDEWQRFANMRLLFGYMFTHPGTQLMFMGGEFGQTSEWNIEKGLEWWLTDYDVHKGLQTWIKALNNFYRSQPALYEKQFEQEGFEWIDLGDHANSVISYIRKGNDADRILVVVCNFTPVVREIYKLGVPFKGEYQEVLNSDMAVYGGADHHKNAKIEAIQETWHGRPYHIPITLPALATVVFERIIPNTSKSSKKTSTARKAKK
ncbi:1,4-alpha-glucan branching protein GlgB [Flavilitoribacter nigricans]|uniref:1,4-alpha-glucan branching enzyme GlgB n=1 Tax=Flavilitoribacter nigricans (strain ATCC 23147 / DSM 23189 / NBRC 102662 / NCIMB 1420 / SS-2) TaxID=1122177 RepID=A0A2D0NEE9_FLAN2|nr:1,4-alpha-glucan branching protein GlgB [Flavilitoribacter nigricans]PHN06884.1 1,4-alpha-glucan branching enzyme [Flavilitoribacter nigricans DSM 23189 = NBRC 102662]